VQRRIFGPKKKKIIDEWRKLLQDELRNLYFSPITITVHEKDDISGVYGAHREYGKFLDLLVEKAEWKRPFARLRRR
jgi:hypothetical protein